MGAITLLAIALILLPLILTGCDDETAAPTQSSNYGADNSASWQATPQRVYVPHDLGPGAIVGQGPPPDFSSDNDTHRLDKDEIRDTLSNGGEAIMETRKGPESHDDVDTLEKGLPPGPGMAPVSEALSEELHPTPEPMPATRPIGGSVYATNHFGTVKQQQAADLQKRRAALLPSPSAPPVALPTSYPIPSMSGPSGTP